jgi:hypothetical protein
MQIFKNIRNSQGKNHKPIFDFSESLQMILILLPILRKFQLYAKPKLIYTGRLDSLRYNFSIKTQRSIIFT